MRFFRRIRAFVFRRRLEAEMAEEMRFHQEARADSLAEDGRQMTEARMEAQRKFGQEDAFREQARDGWGTRLLEEFLADLRFGARTLGKRPGYTAVAVLTLALGIGANAAIYSFMDAIRSRPVEVTDPGTMVQVFRFDPAQAAYRPSFSYPEYAHLREHAQSLRGIIASGGNQRMDFSSNPEAADPASESARVRLVSGNYFNALEAHFHLGRGFLPEEDAVPGRNPVAVVSAEFWRRRLNADPAALGREISIGRDRYTVVGVTASDLPRLQLDSDGDTEIWVPLMMHQQAMGVPAGVLSTPSSAPRGRPAPVETPVQRSRRLDRLESFVQSWLQVRARLAPGFTADQARAELQGLFSGLDEDHPEIRAVTPGARDAAVEPAMLAGPAGASGPALILLFGGPAILLAIGCANVGNLVLARGSSRTHEFAVRRALGAGRMRLVRQLMTENLLLGLAGGLLGLFLAYALSRLIVVMTFGAWALPVVDPATGPRTMAFVLGLSVLAPILFGAMPALWLSGVRFLDSLKRGGAASLGGGSSVNQRQFAATQVALSAILLIVAAVLARVLYRGSAFADDGVSGRIAIVAPDLITHGYPNERIDALADELEARVKAIPGVVAVAWADGSPARSGSTTSTEVEGRGEEHFHGLSVGPDFFDAMGMRFIQGRTFDADWGLRQVIVTEATARRFWPASSPIGKKIGRGFGEGEVVGVVAPRFAPELFPDQPEVFSRRGHNGGTWWWDPILIVRADRDFPSFTALLWAQARAISSEVRPTVRLASAIGSERTSTLRPWAFLAFAIGGIALLLAGIGLHGVMACAVSQRTSEIGLRMALGASRAAVIRLILRQGFRLVLWGAIAGTAAAVAILVLLRTFTTGAEFLTLGSLSAVISLLGATAFVACWLPARRASRIDPMTALRAE